MFYRAALEERIFMNPTSETLFNIVASHTCTFYLRPGKHNKFTLQKATIKTPVNKHFLNSAAALQAKKTRKHAITLKPLGLVIDGLQNPGHS